MAPGPADADGSQDDARHTQSHLHHGEQEQAPQDLATGAHPAPGISPGPAGGGWKGGGQREERSPLLSRLSVTSLLLHIRPRGSWREAERRKCGGGG